MAARIEETARRLLGDLTRAPVGTASFARALRTVDHIGEREVHASTAIMARFGDRRVAAVDEVLADQSSLAQHVKEVRELARGFVRLGASTRPSDRKHIANVISRQEDHVRAVAQALEDDRSALMTDNAMLEQERRALELQIRSLEQFAELAGRLDELLVERVAALRLHHPATARVLETEALYVSRQRQRELLTHVSVALQVDASLRLIEHGNVQVIRALRAASTTTLTALRSAALSLQALHYEPPNGGGVEDPAALAAWSELLNTLDDLDRKRRISRSQIDESGRESAQR